MINNVGYQVNPYYIKRTFPQSFYNYSIKNEKLNPMQKPVSFKEGTKIVAKGIWNKIKDIGKSIIQHPVKTLATIGLTSAALMVLPFLGISMATGGAALVVGFGSLAIFNTCKNIYKAHKNSKKGDFNALRQNLNNIGGDIVDLAMTLPFMPKALKHLKRNVPLYLKKDIFIGNKIDSTKIVVKKYYGGTQTYNYDVNGNFVNITNKNSLFTQVKNAKTWKERLNLFFKQDRTEQMYEKINQAYKQIAKERGYAPHDIKYVSEPMEAKTIMRDGKTVVVGKFDGGFVNSNYAGKININSNTKLEKMLRNIGHEQRHTEQYSMIARMEDLKDAEFIQNNDMSLLLAKKGIIKKGTPEYVQAQKFYEAHKIYPKDSSATNAAYRNNFLEVDARSVGETEIAGQIETQLRKNLKIEKDAPLTFDSAKYNPTKDMIISNGLTIEQQV